jgi:excisionase family DNA binding protein
MEKQNDPSLQPLLLTVPQVAKKLGLSRAMVYVLINREGLPVIRLGRAVRISVTSLQKWVEEREQASMRRPLLSREDMTPTKVSDTRVPVLERSSHEKFVSD